MGMCLPQPCVWRFQCTQVSAAMVLTQGSGLGTLEPGNAQRPDHFAGRLLQRVGVPSRRAALAAARQHQQVVAVPGKRGS